jgi:hypothetical protein
MGRFIFSMGRCVIAYIMFCLVYLSPMSNSASNPPRIAVIGGGVGGGMAAYELHKIDGTYDIDV